MRGVMNDDAKWWALVRETYQTFKYKNILTEDIVALFNKRFGKDVTPIFNEYLRYTQVPTLELAFRIARVFGVIEARTRSRSSAQFAAPSSSTATGTTRNDRSVPT